MQQNNYNQVQEILGSARNYNRNDDFFSPERVQNYSLSAYRQRFGNLLTSNRKKEASLSHSEDQDDLLNNPNEINHSFMLSQDFNNFLFQEQLSDIKIKVRKSNGKFESVKPMDTINVEDEKNFTMIPAHRIVLAARCPYFNSKFCREWKDGNDDLALFEDFSENAMKEFLKYVYTGKLRIDISNIMGILKISSFFGIEVLQKSIKQYLVSGYLNAFDLCILYCEVREESQDFDEMRNFLTQIIPQKIDNQILCKVLKEIYIPNIDSDLNNQAKLEEETEESTQVEEKVEGEEEEQQPPVEGIDEILNKQQDSFEKEEPQKDLQEILIRKIQKNLPDIFANENLKNDFFELPNECVSFIIEARETCISELLLFKTIEEKITHYSKLNEESETQDSQLQFYKSLMKKVRLSLINIKSLVTDVKFSNFFDDQEIFKAIQFQKAPEVLNQNDKGKYEYRGMNISLDLKHKDLKFSINEKSGSTTVKRKRTSLTFERSTVSGIMSDPLPLHGVHYFEVKIVTVNSQLMKDLFIGLCNTNDTQSLEDIYRSKSSVLLNCTDSSFWSNGQQVQVFSNKFIKIKHPITQNDVIRFAVDLRYAKDYQNYWKENLQNQGNTESNINQSPLRNQRGFQAQRERLRDSLRLMRDHSLNLYLNNELMFLSSRCKFHFAFNNTDFHEGVDLNLINLKESPLHLVLSLVSEGVEVEMSRCIYFDDWEMIPKEPFILK